MAKTVKPVPENYHSLTPQLVCDNASAAIDFYKKVFRATEIRRAPGPNGTIMHAELKIGDSTIFISDPMSKSLPRKPEAGSTNPIYLHLYVPDADSVYERAVAGGSRVEMPVQDMFWGDRYGKVTDPYGQQWGIATHIEDVSPEEIARRQQAFFVKAAGQH
jgi:uncharacterized glyoxalase superfamily protein PhnB